MDKNVETQIVEEWDVAGTYEWTVPTSVYEATICMIGGGGAGAQHYTTERDGGGYSGDIVSTVVPLIPGEIISIVVGTGGLGGGIDHGNGGNGTESSFGTTIANGGQGGGVVQNTYQGNGEARDTCMGTFADGTTCDPEPIIFWGGQAGFADGGQATTYDDDCGEESVHGARGSGGGGADARMSVSGDGGDGFIQITYEVRVPIFYVGTEPVFYAKIGLDDISDVYINQVNTRKDKNGNN